MGVARNGLKFTADASGRNRVSCYGCRKNGVVSSWAEWLLFDGSNRKLGGSNLPSGLSEGV